MSRLLRHVACRTKRSCDEFVAPAISSRRRPRRLLDLAKVTRSMPAAPRAAHLNPRPPQDVSAEDLVSYRVEPSPGIGLGRPVKRMLQGPDRIRGRTSPDGGTSRNGTHRAPPPLHYTPTKQRPFPHRRLCCPLGSTSTTAASDAHPARHPFPGTTGYRARDSDRTNIRRLPGRGAPPQFPPSRSERSAPHTPRSSSRLHSRLSTASMAFTLISEARHSLHPPQRMDL